MITIPILKQLCDDTVAEIEAQYGNTISTIGKSALRAVAYTLGAKMKLLYLALGEVQKNMLPDIADSESVGGTLERWGAVKLGRQPYGSTQGQYLVTVTGSIGAVVPGQTTFLSNDSSKNPQKMFILDLPHTMVTTSDTITLRALEGGIESSLNNLDTLTSTSPIALVDSTATVVSESIQPLSAEDIESYRLDVIRSFRLQPQGGSAVDYILWSQDVQGVKTVYPYAASGFDNRVDLYIESDIADSTDGKGTPSTPMIDAVETVVNFNPDTSLPLNKRGRRPLQVIVNYHPITVLEIDITIGGYIGATTEIQALITSALTDYVGSVRPFVDSADVIANKNDIIDANNLSAVILSATPGASFATPTFTVNSVSETSYQFLLGNIPYLNSVTFV